MIKSEPKRQYGNSIVTLAGDSIFDNASYVPVGKPVIEHLKCDLAKQGLEARLIAIDGSIATDVLPQLATLEGPVGFLIISCGGNDALKAADVLAAEVTTVYSAMTKLAEMREQFRKDYRAMLAQAQKHCPKVVVCTVYDSVPGYAIEMMTALALFNDVIIFEANRAGVAVIDLRVICNEPEDYSSISPIEPSHSGGEKIARAIADWVKEQNHVH